MKIKEKFELWADKNELTRQMVNDYGLRTVVFAIGSFAISVAYGVYNFTLAIIGSSIWFGVLAAYYILLAFMRGGVLIHHNKKRKAHKRGDVIENEKIKQIKKYRICGIMLIPMTVALSLAISQMIGEDKTFEHAGLMIYASAAYTFYKITVAIINLVKAKKQTDMTVQAIRDINLADAIVSMLSLQTSLLHTFGGNDGVMFTHTLNGTVGAVVCAIIFGLGIYMIVNAQKKLKSERNCKDAESQENMPENTQEGSQGENSQGE